MQIAGAKKRVVVKKSKSRSASPSRKTTKKVLKRSSSKKAVKRSSSKKAVRRSGSKSKKGGAFVKDLLIPSGWNAATTAWGLTAVNELAHSRKRRSLKKGGGEVMPATETMSEPQGVQEFALKDQPAPWTQDAGAKKTKRSSSKAKKVVKHSSSKKVVKRSSSKKVVKRSSSKRKPSAYIKWYTSEYRKIKKEHPNWDVKQCAKEGGKRWRMMSDKEKAKH